MANDLLASFKAASRQYNHVVFNDRTQQFERAGKRHAIATFFGSADARAKNNLTLSKIKEALAFEVQERGRFSGLGKDLDSLFASVKGDKRINSQVLTQIIRDFKREAKYAPDELRRLKDDVAKRCVTEKDYLPSGSADCHARRMNALLNGGDGGNAVLEMVARRLLDERLADETISSAIESLQDPSRTATLMRNVMSDMMSFMASVDDDFKANAKLQDIFRLVNEKGMARFDRMVGCELAGIVAAHRNSPSTFNAGEALERLAARLEDTTSVQNLAVGMESLPIDHESYRIVLDVCSWSGSSMRDCMSLLNRQPVDSRVPLLAAMKAFGESRDVFLLQRLAGVQDKIKELHSFGNMTPESVYSAIEGGLAQIPECVADFGTSVGADNAVSSYYADRAAAEVDRIIASKGMDEGRRVVVQSEALRLMREFGVSAENAVGVVGEIDGAKYSIFTGERRVAVLDLKAMFGDRFDEVPSAVKYNLMAVPSEYRRPLAEALLAIMNGMSDSERALHFLIAGKDKIKNLWDANLLTAERVLREIAADLVEVPKNTGDWSYESVIGDPLVTYLRNFQIPPESLEGKGAQINTQMERLVFEYGFLPEEARAFLNPDDEELEGVDIGVPDRMEHVNPHYQVIGMGFGEGVSEAFKQLSNDLTREAAYQIAIELPGLNISEVLEPETVKNENGRRIEVGKQCENLERILTGLCGKENQEQIATVLFGMTQATKLVLMPHVLQNGIGRLSDAFSIKYEIGAGENGDVKLRLSNLPDSKLTLDWTLTIHPDGVHEATLPVVAPNQK